MIPMILPMLSKLWLVHRQARRAGSFLSMVLARAGFLPRSPFAKFASIAILSRPNMIGLAMAESKSLRSPAPTNCAVRRFSTSMMNR